MTFFPIFIPAGDETEYIYPGWVNGLFTIALFSIVIGIVALLVCFTADHAADRAAGGIGGASRWNRC
jgi:hypothetical protein